jgi:Protein of unknown function (DUF2726)
LQPFDCAGYLQGFLKSAKIRWGQAHDKYSKTLSLHVKYSERLMDYTESAFVILIVALILMVALLARELGKKPAARRYGYKSNYASTRFEQRAEPHPAFVGETASVAGQQMDAVLAGSFQKQRLLSRSEYQVFKVIEDDLAAAGNGYRVFAQTCLGEVLHSQDSDAFRAVNAKRVDMLIVDRGGWPVTAVEYQGEGHHQGNAAARDAIKKEALRRADVGYVEVFATDSAEQIRYRVREQLMRSMRPPQSPAASYTNILPINGFGRT